MDCTSFYALWDVQCTSNIQATYWNCHGRNAVGQLFCVYWWPPGLFPYFSGPPWTSLSIVFNRLRQAGLWLKAKKCLFLCEEVLYLGRMVSKQGIKPDPSKTDKVRNYHVPTSVSQVWQFLGLAPYYCWFVPEFSKIASPLHAHILLCSVGQMNAKELLASWRACWWVLAYPQFGDPFILETDASVMGLESKLMDCCLLILPVNATMHA